MRRIWSASFAVSMGLIAFGTVAPVQAQSTANFDIVSEDTTAEAGSVSVRIAGRISEADLMATAKAVQSKARTPANADTIKFFLPKMPLAELPWATVRFSPDPKAAIRGLRLDEENAFRAAASNDRRDIVGVWLTSPPALTGMLTIWRDKNRRLFAEWHLRSGTKTMDGLSEQRSNRGRRYVIDGGDGGYYMGLWNGMLELGDGQAVVATAERLTLDATSVSAAKQPPQQATVSIAKTAAPAASVTTAPTPSVGLHETAAPVPRKAKLAKSKATADAVKSKGPTASDLISAALGR